MIGLPELLCTAQKRSASDLLVMVGDTPAIRVHGVWERLNCGPCSDATIQGMVRDMLVESAWDELVKKRELDFSCCFPDTGRVRCNVHFQRDHLAMVLRLVWPEIPDPKALGIPSQVVRMGEMPHGLILVSGPTGSGKLTTLAAIVEHINKERAAHVITIEDPIEFIYSNKRAIIEQREIGSDTPSWQSGLRTVLRQAPDVIVLGELRDLDSISIALSAAETGHLVMASVHSSTAVGAVSRMIDGFPAAQASQVRMQLAQSLRLIFAQRLLPAKGREGRVLAYEILTGTPAVANLVRAGEFEQIPNAISAGREHGMMNFTQCGRELVARGLIEADAKV